MARDITEGRATRAIAVDVGVVASTAIWQNTDVAYDVAVGGLPFIYAISDARPYTRQTAPFRKDQFDNGTEPGEQSLVGWWIRSQSSFHRGAGIKFYDPTGGDLTSYRFFESRGVDVWTKGQVSLLKNCSASSHYTTGALTTISGQLRPQQHLRSIKWDSTSGVLLRDEYDVDKIAADGTATHFINYTAGSGVYPVYAICDDGKNAFWITNATSGGTTKITVYKKPLTGSASSTADEVKMFETTGTITNATMEYVKDRIILCADNKVYEFSSSYTGPGAPTPIFTHPSSTYAFTSITASGSAIYISGYNGIQSSIFKFTISSTGTLPTLTSAVVAAELPVGEVVHRIFYYLGYMMIGTSKGVRAAIIQDTTGDITYGPLLFESPQPVYDFAARDKFVWATTGVDVEGQIEPGLTRINLGEEIESLRFAYANDVEFEGVYGHTTTGVAFADGTDRITFCTDYASENGQIYIEDASTLISSGFITTGNLRYSTLEPKNFKRLLGRGDFTYGSMVMETVDSDGLEYDHITYDSTVHNVEVTTLNPATAQEYVAYKFLLTRDTTDTSLGPVFTGYQVKATIATPRQRLIQFPVYCFDVETDRYNVVKGREGQAFERIKALEAAEESGDVVTWQDLNTGESRQATIEQISFTRLTPPDKRFDGFGGVINITVRTV